MAHNVNERANTRSAQPALAGEPADFSRGGAYDSIRGEQIYVYYWRVETPGLTVPGVPTDAQIGDWFVSPELMRRIRVEPQLLDRFPAARQITDAGVGSADELVAYRLVGPDADLTHRLRDEPGLSWIGLNAGVKTSEVAAGGAVIVLVIGSGLLLAALGPATVGLNRRLALLRALGASGRSVWMVGATSAAVAAMPGTLASALAWYVIAPRLESIPLVGQRILPGDLEIPALLSVSAAVAVTLLVATLGTTRVRQPDGSRPASRIPTPPSRWRLAPATASTLAIVSATVVSGELSVGLLLMGALGASISVILATPVLMHRLGVALARAGSTFFHLAGRNFSWQAGNSSRPLTVLASVAVLVPLAASYITVARERDPEPPPSAVSAIDVNGPLDETEIRMLESEARGVFVDTYRSKPEGTEESTWTWVGDCEKLAPLVSMSSCGSDGIRLDPSAASAFARFDVGTTASPVGHHVGPRLFVTRDLTHAESVLRTYALNRGRLGLSVNSHDDYQMSESRVVPWIMAGIVIGSVTVLLTLMLSVATGASRNAATRQRLLAVGADPRVIRRLAAAESATIVAVVGLSGVSLGTVGAVAYAAVDGLHTTYLWPSGVLTAAVLAAAGLAAATSATVVSRIQPKTWLRTSD